MASAKLRILLPLAETPTNITFGYLRHTSVVDVHDFWTLSNQAICRPRLDLPRPTASAAARSQYSFALPLITLTQPGWARQALRKWSPTTPMSAQARRLRIKTRVGWDVLVVFLSLALLVGCQGLSAGAPSSQQQPPPAGTLALASSSVNFGSVKVGASKTLTVTASNSGKASLTVNSAVPSSKDFSLTQPALPLTIAAGQNATLSLMFKPSASGTDSASLAIGSDASNSSLSLPLTGTGVAAGQLALSPTTIAFGNVTVGVSLTQSETLTNIGGTTVTVSQAAVSGSGLSINGLALPFTLTAGQSANFNVVFAPQTTGAVSGNVAFTSDASNSSLSLPLTGTGVSEGLLAVNPTSIALNNVVVGSSQKQQVTLTNSGGSTLTVSQATVTGSGFSLSGLTLPLSLTAGQSAGFNVVFAPQTVGAVNGNIAFTSDASDPTLNLPLSGTGVNPGLLAVNPSSVAIGSVLVGSSQKQQVMLTNSGGVTVTVSQATVTGSGFGLSGLTLPLTLTAGQSANFNVVFAPQSAGAVSGNVAFTSDASNPSLNLPLSGTGLTAGSLSANPSSVNFGTVEIGNTQTVLETLTNTGGSSVTITQGTLSGTGFSVNGLSLPLTLGAGQSASFNLQFAPQSAGAASGSLSITSNAPNPSLVIPLAGNAVTPGLLTASILSLNFGTVTTGKSKTLSETLSNTGGSSVTITQASVSGSGFSMNGLSLPLTLAPGQSSPSFNVVFAPQSAGAASGNLSVTSDASDPNFTVPLSGTGVTPGTLGANPASLSFGSVQVGNNKSLSETVTNTGGTNVNISGDTVTGTGFSVSGLNPPLTLTPSQSVTFNVVFTPQSAGSASGNLAIASDASNPTLNISLSGTGTALGQLAVSPTSLSFGSVVVGTNSTLPAQLNATGASVKVTSVNISNSEFTLSGISFPVTIPAGQSAQFNVIFAPQANGAASGTASFTSNASNSPTVLSLSGTGTAPPVHSVLLSWTASVSPNITGYNVYRGTQSGGPYPSKLTSTPNPGTTYTDNSVVDGQTYYYVTTAVDSNNQESANSNETSAVIPPP